MRNDAKNNAVRHRIAACISPLLLAAMLLPSTGTGGTVVFDDILTADAADTDWRYLAITTGTTCPMATGWSRGKLFRVTPDHTIPPGLDKYCVYTALTAEPIDATLLAQKCPPVNPPDNCLSQLDKDSLSMAHMGLPTQTVEGLVWENLRAHFLAQAGEVGPLPAVSPKVRLSFVDTEPTGDDQDTNGQGNSPHGFSLMGMARDLICPASGGCGVQIRAGLGLPLVRCAADPTDNCVCANEPTGVCENTVNGGHVGTIGDVARAVHSEVVAWGNGSEPHLVLNLSVAWDRLFGGEAPVSGSRVAVQAALSAIEDARCRGALVIAAAGNRVSGPETASGPLYPGGWEQLQMPDGNQCKVLLGFEPDPSFIPPQGSYNPLVYAAGAVKNDGSTASARPGGEPRLVAFGDHAVAETKNQVTGDVGPTATLTGSSVAAAVVSSAAAAAWFYRPNAAPWDIMEKMYDSASAVGRLADFCTDAAPGSCLHPVQRLSVCHAVDHACNKLGGTACPAFDCEDPIPLLPEIPTADIAAQFAGDPVVDVSTLLETAVVPQCSSSYKVKWKLADGPPANPCPQFQFYGVQATPWTDGQPSGQPCEVCTGQFASPGDVFVEVKQGFVGQLTDLTLLCGADVFALGETLVAGQRLMITEIPEVCESTSMAIAYVVTNGGASSASAVSPILLVLDRDDDGVQDGLDNCILEANPDQRDTDADGIGNLCDADLTGVECIVNFADLGVLKDAMFSQPGDAHWDEDADLNGDAVVNFTDLGMMKEDFFAEPGPSATGCN